MTDAPILEACQLRRVSKTGVWLTVHLYAVNITDMGDQEWQNFLFICYCIYPPDLPSYWDGCNSALSIYNALDCKKGSLIINHINKLCDGVVELAGKDFTPSHVHNAPSFIHVMQCGRKRPIPWGHFSTIHPWMWRIWSRRETFWPATSGREGGEVFTTCVQWNLIPSPTGTSLRRSVSIWRRIRRSTCSIVTINTNTPPRPPFVLLKEGILGMEAEDTFKHTARRLARKWKQP